MGNFFEFIGGGIIHIIIIVGLTTIVGRSEGGERYFRFVFFVSAGVHAHVFVRRVGLETGFGVVSEFG